jgi:hypothetical protein
VGSLETSVPSDSTNAKQIAAAIAAVLQQN